MDSETIIHKGSSMTTTMLFNPAVLEERLAVIEAQNREILELLNAKKYVTQKDIAKSQGVGAYTLIREPWRMPNFGMADEGTRPKKWYKETVRRWEETPIDQHRNRWNAMSPAERNKYMGIKE
jgi:hypothetical protein